MKISKKRSSKAKGHNNNLKYQITGIAMITVAALGAASLFTDALGPVGKLLIDTMDLLAGKNEYLIVLAIFLCGFKFTSEKSKIKMTPRSVGFMIIILVLLTFAHINIPKDLTFQQGLTGQGGGIIGAISAYIIMSFFGRVGTYIILSSLTLVAITLITGYTLGQLGLLAALKTKKTGSEIWNWIFDLLTEDVEQKNYSDKRHSPTQPALDFYKSDQEISESSKAAEGSLPRNGSKAKDSPKKTHKDAEDIFSLPAQPLADGRIYSLPSISLLNKPKKITNEVSEREITERTRILEATLANFGIAAKVSGISVGPAITRYEIQPPPGIKVSRIVGLSDDIALGMAAPGVRIEAPIPGKAAVGIEVPNREISPVALRELLEKKEFSNSPSKLTVALGKDITGTTITADLGKMPHLLVAGATGAGKSVCMNTIIASILFKATPDEVKLLMIDPKKVELTNFNGIPHLISPVVTDSKKAAGVLRWAVKEMEQRYEKFALAGVRDIGRYNKANQDIYQESSPIMPYIIIIIDELADLMMVAPADVEDSICRLAQMARAAGIHLVIATQRPSVDVITGLIKANIPSRISFAVSSLVDSRTILDMGGAEKLLGRGDMLFCPVGTSKPTRVQGAFLSDREVETLVDYIKEQAKPIYDEDVLNAPPAGTTKQEAREDSDELLSQAVKIFIESGTASISMLQRRLRVGYGRAARLVDIMERMGIVGGFEGSKPRSILMSLDEYYQTFDNEQ
ncbi:MAG: DNA translocase FtsK [Peptococcaceae bacterium]|nr:DNA translocase FtsK [Peptococcaceae bacterium]